VSNLVVLGQTVRTYRTELAGKWAPRVPPFKVTESQRNQHGSIGYLWLPITDT